MSGVEVRGVSKVFRPPPAPWRRVLHRPTPAATVALRGVDLRVAPGEVVGLVGRNGAGKTVLVKVIATLTQPTSGTVTVHGRDAVRDARAVRALVGLASCDERSFYWRLTGRQNLRFFARLHGLGRRASARRIAELADLLDLDAVLDRSYSVLSAGNRQRLAVARALLAEPPVLLLDEPTRSLDPAAAARLRGVVAERLAGQARAAVLFTTHDAREAEQVCTRVAVLDGGEVAACEDVAALRARFGAETVTVTAVGALPGGELARLRGAVPGIVCENGRAGRLLLRFQRQAADDRLDAVLGALVRAGARIERCDSAPDDDLFERAARGSDA